MNISEKYAKNLLKSEIKAIGNISVLYSIYKITVFVPEENVSSVIKAMSSAGAGVIGNYTSCSFGVVGTGTFRGNKKSNPAAGRKGNFEMVDEIRLEMTCSKSRLHSVLEKMLKAHPYEEPAYDIYEVLSGSKFNSAAMITLKRKLALDIIFKKLNKSFSEETMMKEFRNIKVKIIIFDMDTNEEAKDYLVNTKEKYLVISKNKKKNIKLMLK